MHTELYGSESNLVAYYNFNDGSGITSTDLTSNSNDGTMITWMQAVIGYPTPFAQDYALDFDGTNDQIQIAYNSSLRPRPSNY